jgi:hypothetical protein
VGVPNATLIKLIAARVKVRSEALAAPSLASGITPPTDSFHSELVLVQYQETRFHTTSREWAVKPPQIPTEPLMEIIQRFLSIFP